MVMLLVVLEFGRRFSKSDTRNPSPGKSAKSLETKSEAHAFGAGKEFSSRAGG